MPSEYPTTEISKKHARRFLVKYHFLNPARNLNIKQSTNKLFNRLGCIQFDTINVVGRNADLVLQSRIKNYTPEILERLLYEERVLIDGWDKVASIFQTLDWPFFDRHREYIQESHRERSPKVSQVTPSVLEVINKYGPMSSIDFKDNSKTDWAWGPTSLSRAALETLYAQGKIGIHHRVNTRRYFDLIERLVPHQILNSKDPNELFEDYAEWHINRRIGGVGIASPKSGEHWLGIHNLKKATDRNAIIKQLKRKEKIHTLKIEGLERDEFYIQSEYIDLLNSIKENKKNLSPTAAFIAPLDNLIWNRRLIKDIFDFHYVWEVYKPKKDRMYGYYVLPVLYGDSFIARVDLKFDRYSKVLYLNNWWWEEKVEFSYQMKQAIKDCFHEFVSYLGATDIHSRIESDSTEFDGTFLP